ncbi:MAG: GatB/YqeY domain-containing protein [Cytophagaceae bacterium]|nr:GatB/YqeY domain-containing protein [Cytophagaceae bacterium]
MSLKDKIEADIKKAMLAKEKDELRALRGIKSLILLAETEKGAKTDLSQDDEIKLLMKAAKQRKESAEIYGNQGRKDLEEIEMAEYRVIERYLPKQLTEEEVIEKLKVIIKNIGATGPQDMGKVMGAATKELSGQAEGKVISFLVKSLLNQSNN